MEKYETDLNGYVPLRYSKDGELLTSNEYSINLQKMRIINRKKRILKASKSGMYYTIGIHSHSKLMHRLIWEHCNGLIPEDKVVDHIDDNPDNNRIENLQLLTQAENVKKSVKNRDYSFARKNHERKHTVKARDTVTGEINIFPSLYACQQYYEINCGVIKMCCERINRCKSGISKKNNHKIKFEYTNEVPTITKLMNTNKTMITFLAQCDKETASLKKRIQKTDKLFNQITL